MESIKKHVKIVALFTVFVFFIAFAITNQTEFPTESNIAANFTVELANAPETISNINPGTIHTEKLKEKPISVKTPHFEPLQYLNIHNYNATNSSITIRLFNEWNRSDLTIYHYAGDDWQPLETRINGSYLEAVTYSFSVFAVGAQGGININLLADDFTFLNNTATIASAAFYNNSTASASIAIEINPSWSGYANTTTDTEGNFVQILSGPTQPGNYKVWVNATSGSLNGSKDISINATNATLFRINASASITNTTGPSTNTNISFAFPVDAVPEFANLILNLGSSTNTEVKVNNITIYNGITDNANLNLIGYFDTQNDINITTGTSVTHIYNISFNFHITETATVTQPSYYSAALSVSNDMSYDWNNSNVTFHLPDSAYTAVPKCLKILRILTGGKPLVVLLVAQSQ
ncbi:MAG: hypothetical protein E4G94_00760 [ANME-2 cluster archaeon]|nr:MAG: hypothetical protein E4G94_00760 [ANME-2 cluster archaeon]